MWRVPGYVGRVLHRCHASTPLRLPQNHHVEDEVFNSTVVLSTSRQSSDSSSKKEQDEEKRKKQRTFQYGFTELPQYTVLDAVGWGAATALFMQICRRIHSNYSSGTDTSPPGALTTPSSLHNCGYRILLEILSRRDILPRGSTSVFCQQEVPKRQIQDQDTAPSNSSSSDDTTPHSSTENVTTHCSTSDHQRAVLNHDSPTSDQESLLSASCPLQNDAGQVNAETDDAVDKGMLKDEENLAGAAQNLRHVGDGSVPVILNIIGLESAKDENYDQAFSCFLAAAQQGYSKAQFNVGVCYEKGRGVNKNKEKAQYYYQKAAAGGHTQAQYRYAKLLLASRGHQSLEELSTAIDMLEQAAAAGLTKAQLCLASVHCQEPVKDESKSVKYLQMAAENGDDTALLFLGQCYESGFGVQQNPSAAIEFYKRAANAGNKEAKSLLTPPKVTDLKSVDAALRSIHSAPCFSVAEHRLQQPLSALASRLPPSALPLLPHSWSTGSLCAPPMLSSTPLHLHPQGAEGGTCQWTLGIG